MHYKLRIIYNVTIAKWRIDNPLLPNSSNWALQVFDRNLNEWVYLTECKRPGEYTYIEKIEVIDPDTDMLEEASGSKPEDSIDGDNSDNTES